MIRTWGTKDISGKDSAIMYLKSDGNLFCELCHCNLLEQELFIYMHYKLSLNRPFGIRFYCFTCSHKINPSGFIFSQLGYIKPIDVLPANAFQTMLKPELSESNKGIIEYLDSFRGKDINHCVYANREDELNRISGEEELQAKRKELADLQEHEQNKKLKSETDFNTIFPDIKIAKILKPSEKSQLEQKEEQLNKEWITFKKEDIKLISKEVESGKQKEDMP